MKAAIDGRRAARDLARLYAPLGKTESQPCDRLAFEGTISGERFPSAKNSTDKLGSVARNRPLKMEGRP